MLIHGSVVHKSAPNYSAKSRYIYTFHVIEGQARYPKDNWYVVGLLISSMEKRKLKSLSRLQPSAEMPFTAF